MVILMVVSVIGIYALGQGLSGLVEPGKGVNLLWLAVSAVAIWILAAQMGRVHDAWPRRDDSDGRLAGPAVPEDPGAIGRPTPSANEGGTRS